MQTYVHTYEAVEQRYVCMLVRGKKTAQVVQLEKREGVSETGLT